MCYLGLLGAHWEMMKHPITTVSSMFISGEKRTANSQGHVDVCALENGWKQTILNRSYFCLAYGINSTLRWG